MSMKRNFIITAIFSAFTLLLLMSCSGSDQKKETPATKVSGTTAESVNCEFGFNPDTLTVVKGEVKNGQFFSTLLNSLGMGASEAYALTQATEDVFDVTKFRIGNKYEAYYAGESLRYLVYALDRTRSIVFDCYAPYKAWLHERPTVCVERYGDVTINTSLSADLEEAGLSQQITSKLENIYEWSIDFFGLQKGDRCRFLYQEVRCGDELIKIDTIRYAVFTHAGKDYPAVLFDQNDRGNLYWNDKGESMKKSFLKAPLQFTRVSSGFTYARKHPITRQVRPHTGVDYAAPTGTPVRTIGDGVVTSIKYEGAGGNTVRIKHNSVYSTAYLHLHGYAKGLKVGQRVRQGEVIGYVGSTGRSTGPHLDFRVWKNGTPINPLTMDSPPAEPIKAANKPAFEAAIKAYEIEMAKVSVIEEARTLYEFL